MKQVKDNVILLKDRENYCLLDREDADVFIKYFKTTKNVADALYLLVADILNVKIPEHIYIFGHSNDFNLEENFSNLTKDNLRLEFNFERYSPSKQELPVFDEIDNTDQMDVYVDISKDKKYKRIYKLTDLIKLDKENLIKLFNVDFSYSEYYLPLVDYKDFLKLNFPKYDVKLIGKNLRDLFYIENDNESVAIDYPCGDGFCCAAYYNERYKDIIIHLIKGYESYSIKEIRHTFELKSQINLNETIGINEVIKFIKNENINLYNSFFKENEGIYYYQEDDYLDQRIKLIIKKHTKENIDELSPINYGYNRKILNILKEITI